MKKILLVLITVLMLAGCSEGNQPKNITKEKAKYTPEEVLIILQEYGYVYSVSETYDEGILDYDDGLKNNHIYKRETFFFEDDGSYTLEPFMLINYSPYFNVWIGEPVQDISVSVGDGWCQYNFVNKEYSISDYPKDKGKSCGQLGIDKVNQAILDYEIFLNELGLNYNDMLVFAKNNKLQ